MKILFEKTGSGVEIGYSENFPEEASVMVSRIPTHLLVRIITRVKFDDKDVQVRFTFDPRSLKVVGEVDEVVFG
jgi:hypothetical protein